MKWTQRRPLIAFLALLLTLFSVQAAQAAVVSVTLLPGRLTIIDAPATLTYFSTTTTDTITTLDATFNLDITDATGKKAGWNLQAMLGPLTRADGSTVPLRSSILTNAQVAPLTGIAPQNTLTYPRSFIADGDTLFSAAPGTGVGKSSLALTTEMTVFADPTDTAPLTASLTMTITAGP